MFPLSDHVIVRDSSLLDRGSFYREVRLTHGGAGGMHLGLEAGVLDQTLDLGDLLGEGDVFGADLFGCLG